jgi:hypothetical protein
MITVPTAKQQRQIKELRTIPGIGKSLALDLWNIGIRKVDDLKNKNPNTLYRKLNRQTGTAQDPCVLYTFRCAIYFASERIHDADKLKWWYCKNNEYNEQ